MIWGKCPLLNIFVKTLHVSKVGTHILHHTRIRHHSPPPIIGVVSRRGIPPPEPSVIPPPEASVIPLPEAYVIPHIAVEITDYGCSPPEARNEALTGGDIATAAAVVA
jgi:hypothetical protein